MARTAFWLAAAVVAVLSLAPVAYLTAPVFDWWDKAQHATAFATLAILGVRAYPGRLGVLVAGLLGFGAAIELAQHASGWRYGEWWDLAADAVGLSLGAALALRWRKAVSAGPVVERASRSLP